MKCSLWGMQSIRYKYSLFTLLTIVLLAGIILLSPKPAHAVTTVPTKMNFQGRLTNSSGNILADGSYNMTFRLYTASSGGSAVWTEVRDTTNRVAVANGLFSVRLGDVTSIPASLFASGSLYLEIELPSPATATCSTAACASYTEGPMTPRNQLATSAYSFNSETLDGLDSSAFAQLTASNTFTNNNLIKTTSASAFGVQDASGSALLSADTLNGNVMIGAGTATEKLDIIGNWKVRDASTPTKAVRVRTSGLDLDFETGGDKIQFSTWSGAGMVQGTDTQYNQFRLNSDGTPINFQRAIDLVNDTSRGADTALKITGSTSGGVSNQTADLFQLKATSTAVLMAVNPTGATTLKNSSNSTAEFMVQNTAGNELFQIDSTNSRVYIGDTTADSTGTLLVLDTKNTSGDPTGVNGGMYYNSNTSDFRCYVGGGWQSCQSHSESVNGLVTGGTTTISTTSYTNLTTPSSISYTKLGGSNTNLVITMSATMYATVAAGTGAYLGVNVDSTDYDCGNLYFNQINVYGTVSCSVTIPSLNAGAKTIQMRWKRGLGTGSLNSSTGAAWNSMTVTETN